MLHYNITVMGIVQGVSFRKSTQEIANTLGITGFVKNLSNGNVYIEAEGEECNMKKFVEWCKKGPKSAIVHKVEIVPDCIKNYDSFFIQ